MQWTPPVIESVLTHDTSLSIKKTLDALAYPVRSEPGFTNVSSEHNVWRLAQMNPLDDDTRTGVLGLIRPDGLPLSIDFTRGKSRHRFLESNHGAGQLKRALGIRQMTVDSSAEAHTVNNLPMIIDATGGLGQDAWVIALSGCQVKVYESHPVVHALLKNALERATEHPDFQKYALRIELILNDATEALRRAESLQSTSNDPEPLLAHAIYLDPMYPRRRSKAKASKGMQFLQALLGPVNPDTSRALLLSALNSKVNRVVVKRPKAAPLLEGSESWSGQFTQQLHPNTRFDIFHLHSASVSS